jgi:micrococcal nuclease
MVEENKFVYSARITKVYDGDTLTADIDIGFHVWVKKEKLRLYGIDAPEVRGKSRPEGLISRDWLRKRLLNKDVTIKTLRDKKGKYGRYIATIYIDGVNVNEELVSKGLAVFSQY